MKKNLLKVLTLTAMLALSVGAVTSCSIQGADGTNGQNGKDGTDGKDGVDGKDGEKGDKGEKGEKGAAGDKGDTGAKGDTGEKGEKGDTGATGAKGEKGEKGDTGAAGKDGLTPRIDEATGHWFVGTEDTGVAARGEKGNTYFPIIILANPENVTISVDDNKTFVQAGESFTIRFTTADPDVEMVTSLKINYEKVIVPVGQLYWTHTAKEGDKGYLVQSVEFGMVKDYAIDLMRETFNDMFAFDTEVATIKEDLTRDEKGVTGYANSDIAGQALTDIEALRQLLAKPETLAKTPEEKIALVESKLEEYAEGWQDLYDDALADAKKAAIDYAASELYGANKGDIRDRMTATDRAALLEQLKNAVNDEQVDTLGKVAAILDAQSTPVKGQYIVIENTRKQMFTDLYNYYLNTCNTKDDGFLYDESSKLYNESIATLIRDYKLDESKLPYGIFARYSALISAWNGSAVQTYVKDAKAELDVAIENARETIGNNILEAYRQEIYSSSKIDEAQKLSAFVAVKSRLQDWIGNLSNKTSMMGSYAAQGLLGGIEALLSTANNTAGITEAFIAERKQVVLSSAKGKVEAAKATVLAKDARYAALCELTATGSAKIPTVSYNGQSYNNTIGESASLNVNLIAKALLAQLEGAQSDVGEVKRIVATGLNTLDVYTKALNSFATEMSLNVENWYNSKVQSYGRYGYFAAGKAAFENKIFASAGVLKDSSTFASVEEALGCFAGYVTLVDALELKVQNFIGTNLDMFDGNEILWKASELYKGLYGTKGLAEGIFSGTTTVDAINNYATGMQSVYEQGVKDYLAQRLVDLIEVRSGAIADDGIKFGGVHTDAIWEAYQAQVKAAESVAKTYTAVKNWYTAACQAIKNAYVVD